MSTAVTDFPKLFKRATTGKIQEWSIWVVDSSIHTSWGQRDGKQQKSVDVIREGKNIGKRNETTPAQQAEIEAQAQWEAKLKRGYVQSLDAAKAGEVDAMIEGGISPMLAHRYDQHGHKIQWPAYAQPKLDGHRCLAVVRDGQCTLWSRTRKPITGVPHISRAVAQLVTNCGMYGRDVIFDGELYNHEYRDKFEELSSFIRQSTPKAGHEDVQYHIYDIASATGDFAQRSDMLKSYRMSGPYDALRFVRTVSVTNEDDLLLEFEGFLAAEYEGAMVRNADGLYVNKRSYDLQKIKEFQDSEFLIVGVEEGRGKLVGHAIFVCTAENKRQFRVKLKGAQEILQGYWQRPDACVGKQLTVKYQGLTADGIPRFPVGLRIKEEL